MCLRDRTHYRHTQGAQNLSQPSRHRGKVDDKTLERHDQTWPCASDVACHAVNALAAYPPFDGAKVLK